MEWRFAIDPTTHTTSKSATNFTDVCTLAMLEELTSTLLASNYIPFNLKGEPMDSGQSWQWDVSDVIWVQKRFENKFRATFSWMDYLYNKITWLYSTQYDGVCKRAAMACINTSPKYQMNIYPFLWKLGELNSRSPAIGYWLSLENPIPLVNFFK